MGAGAAAAEAWVWPVGGRGEVSGTLKHTAPSLLPGPQLTHWPETRGPGGPEERATIHFSLNSLS